MKRVSFSIPSSSSSKRSKLTASSPPSSPDQTKEYITEFDSSETTEHESKNHLIIQPIPNQWKFHVSNVEKQDPNATNNVSDTLDNTKAKNINHAEEKPMSWIARLKSRKLKDDDCLEKVHDDGVEELDVSPDEFANAYMKAYGWREGKGVGKNVEKDDKGVEYKKGNNTRVGLGFVEVNGGER